LSKKHKAAPPQEEAAIEETNSASNALVEGLVIEGNRGQYHVETADGIIICTLRGKLRKQFEYPVSQNWHHNVQRMKIKARDPLSVGDHVRVLPTNAGNGVIEEIIKSSSHSFTREDSKKGNVRSVAGLDQVVVVFATRDPAPHLRLLDRFLVVAEAQELATVICINKVDLGVDDWLAARLDVYRKLGYAVALTSADSGAGLGELRGLLAGHISAFLGSSGVGKSTLLNALQPGLSERVSEISASTHKGRHTTTGTRLVPLGGAAGGYIADTAGIRALALGGVAAGRLAWCFREFRPYLDQCSLGYCHHTSEPGCAIRAAVALGRLDRERYESYQRLYQDGGDAVGKSWFDAVSSEDHRLDKLAYTPGV